MLPVFRKYLSWLIFEWNKHKQKKYEITCVSAFLEILLSLQCKIFQYTFLEQYPMEFQDFFSLCQIQQLTLLQLDHRKLGPSEIRLLSDPCIIKLRKRKNTLSCVICCFENHFWVIFWILYVSRLLITYILSIQTFKTFVQGEINKI